MVGSYEFEDSAVLLGNRLQDLHILFAFFTGIGEGENYSAQVFPNPAAEFIQLHFAGDVAGRTLTLTDLQGRSMVSQPASEKEVSVDLRGLRNGIYILG